MDRQLEDTRPPEHTTAAVELVHVQLDYGAYHALSGISLSVPRGQFVSIVGPTGCGKSSILNLVAGLLRSSDGEIWVDGTLVKGLCRTAGYMFQGDGLLPWRSALHNVMLGPRLHGSSTRQARAEAHDWLRRVGLGGFEHRYPHQLSGGQRKRVAMAQTLINRPRVLLMDEPFGALDAQTRSLMGQELLGLWRESEATVLFVTHDLEEAIALSDRVILLTAGPASSVKGDYPVELARPREVTSARFIPGFADIYERVWHDLKEEVMRTYERARAS